MSAGLVYALAGVVLFTLGMHAVVACRHLLRKILAVNVMGSGVFLVLVGLAEPGDAVPQAMVLTGIVVAVSATAAALRLLVALRRVGGRVVLSEDGDERD